MTREEGIIKTVQTLFEKNASLTEVFLTDDLQLFTVKNYAENHQREIHKPFEDIKSIKRDEFESAKQGSEAKEETPVEEAKEETPVEEAKEEKKGKKKK